jgi:hypothetical protein
MLPFLAAAISTHYGGVKWSCAPAVPTVGLYSNPNREKERRDGVPAREPSPPSASPALGHPVTIPGARSVVVARNIALTAEIQVINIHTETMIETVNLIKALGGGRNAN